MCGGCLPPSPDTPAIDTPDRAALEDNPLAIAGLHALTSYQRMHGLSCRARPGSSVQPRDRSGLRVVEQPMARLSAQKAGMSMAASGSVVSSQSRLPGGMPARRLRAFSTGRGQFSPLRS